MDAGKEDGDFIGAYRVHKRLGKGGMGEVFLAYDDRLDRRVAIKRIRHGKEGKDTYRERFRQEARAVAKLNHPAIAQVYDVVFGEGGDSIVMEYVPGETLSRSLAEGKLDTRSALDVMIQVAQGLIAAHKEGFVHRDLKADNVMVTPERTAKILDFGLAKPLVKDEGQGSLTEDGAVLGTVSSMSPEQAAGFRVDTRSDLFSFGVLLYEVFTGRSPFRHENRLRSLHSVIHDLPPPVRALRPELPRELSELIEAMLEKDPERRPESAARVAETLREISSLASLADYRLPSKEGGGELWMSAPTDEPTGSYGPGPAPWRPTGVSGGPGRGEAAFRWTSRRRWLVTGTAAAGALSAVLLLLQWGWGAETRYVVVVKPELGAAENARSEQVATGVLEAAFSFLNRLEGIVAIDRSGDAGAEDYEDIASEEAAHEVLKTWIDCDGGTCSISFRRTQAKEGIVLGDTERRDVLAGDHSLALANAVWMLLKKAYPDREMRGPNRALEVEDRDYADFLRFKRRLDEGETLDDEDLGELSRICESSPGFFEGFILAASVARTLRKNEKALAFLSRAEELDPGDPRPLLERLRIETDDGRLRKAAETLARLESLAPADQRMWLARAALLDKEGRQEEARSVLEDLVEKLPSWGNVVVLADHRRKSGDLAAARSLLEQHLERFPRNHWMLAKLGEIETISGNLPHADTIYRDLIKRKPRRSNFVHNLGWVQFLLGEYSQAEANFRQTLELDAENELARLNLALVIEAQGRLEESRFLLTELAESIVEKKHIIYAQCLARLGKADQAVDIVSQYLAHYPDDLHVFYQASQVYALAGEPSSAVHYLKQAVGLGLSPAWLRIPGFAGLEENKEFQDLLERGASPDGERPDRLKFADVS